MVKYDMNCDQFNDVVNNLFGGFEALLLSPC